MWYLKKNRLILCCNVAARQCVGMACAWDSVGAMCIQPVGNVSVHLPLPVWRYKRTICTGLGDRLGAMLTVATLARLAGTEVEMHWCSDPQEVYSDIKPFIPGWHGYNYDLDSFLERFEIPGNIRWVKQYSKDDLPEISYVGNEVKAHEALDQVYTTAMRTTRLDKVVLDEDYIRAYHVVGSQLNPRVRVHGGKYIVVHMRAPDENTYALDWDPSLFCSHKAVAGLQKLDIAVVVISNDLAWAKSALEPLYATKKLFNGTVFDDMSLLLDATGIIQHATPGYSSYSSVPAMACGIPLLNTYRGPNHRYDLFLDKGELPSEFYRCRNMKAFFRRVVS